MCDCISRETAIEELYKLPCKMDEDGYRWVLSRDVAHAIDEIPAADVKPVVHGEWKTAHTVLGDCCICSVCGSCNSMEYKYCPYCGADMNTSKK